MSQMPMSWKKLSEVVRLHKHNIFQRTNETQAAYELYQKQYPDLKTMIVDEHFARTNYDFVIAPNRFPYLFENDILHLVIWGRPRCVTHDRLKDMAETIVDSLVRDHHRPAMYRINTSVNMSIPSVPHAHLFVKLAAQLSLPPGLVISDDVRQTVNPLHSSNPINISKSLRPQRSFLDLIRDHHQKRQQTKVYLLPEEFRA